MKYYISGDKTGVTYGIYKGDTFFTSELIKSEIKSIEEASKYIDKLVEEDKTK